MTSLHIKVRNFRHITRAHLLFYFRAGDFIRAPPDLYTRPALPGIRPHHCRVIASPPPVPDTITGKLSYDWSINTPTLNERLQNLIATLYCRTATPITCYFTLASSASIAHFRALPISGCFTILIEYAFDARHAYDASASAFGHNTQYSSMLYAH